MNLLTTLSTFLLALAQIGMVYAQSSSAIGFYGKGFIGATFPDDVTIENELGARASDISADKDVSFGAALGMTYAGNLRAEVALANRAHDVSGSSFSGSAGQPGAGGAPGAPGGAGLSVDFDISITTVMLNGYFDFPVAEGLTLFGTGGLGVSFIDADDLSFQQNPAAVPTIVSGDSTEDFAWQLGFGGAYEMAPDVTLEASYRYIDFGTGESQSEQNQVDPFVQPLGLGRESFDLDTQELAFAVRFAF